MNLRIDKYNAEIQKEMGDVLKEINDPRWTGMATVTKVDLTRDFSHCTIYVSIYDAENKTESFRVLEKSKSFIRHKLASKIDIRIMPELHFVLDDSLDYVAKMDKLFNQIKKQN